MSDDRVFQRFRGHPPLSVVSLVRMSHAEPWTRRALALRLRVSSPHLRVLVARHLCLQLLQLSRLPLRCEPHLLPRQRHAG